MIPEKLVKCYGTPFSARCVNLRLERSLMAIFLPLSRLHPTFIYPNKHFAAILYRVLLQFHVSPTQLAAFIMALKPKWRDKNDHTVLCRTSGLETPNRPLLKSLSSSSSVNERMAFGLLPLPAFCTKRFRLAAKTLRDIANSLCARILNGDFPSERNL